MTDIKLSMRVRGVKEFARKVDLTNKATFKYAKEVVHDGTRQIEGLAKGNVPKRTGELEGTIRSEFGRDGMVGWVRAGYGRLVRRGATTKLKQRAAKRAAKRSRAMRKLLGLKRVGITFSKRALLSAAGSDAGVYAPVVEHGDRRRNKPARHFLRNAFETAAPSIGQQFAQVPDRAAREAGL